MRVFVREFTISGGLGDAYAVEFTMRIDTTDRENHEKLHAAVEPIFDIHRAPDGFNRTNIANALRHFADAVENDRET